jgi:redox-sensitive bicupin YhaK (pirin superfamily)
MSTLHSQEPSCTERQDAIELVIEGRAKDLGGFFARRVLPSPKRKTVGPFIFFDEMGPAAFPPGEGINVRPHPHIGLATVTFLFDGHILHRDSLGFVQTIEPGAVNLMTAGRGIVHSERTPPERERAGQRLHGIQTWMALPQALQEIEPAFVHYPKETLPIIERDGVTTTVIIGDAHGARSPVSVHADTLYLDCQIEDGVRMRLPDNATERAVYVVSGRVAVAGCTELGPGSMAVLRPGSVELHAAETSRLMMVGGEPIGRRIIWWNFVHASQERINDAKHDWKEGAFARVPDDDEFIPLPLD